MFCVPIATAENHLQALPGLRDPTLRDISRLSQARVPQVRYRILSSHWISVTSSSSFGRDPVGRPCSPRPPETLSALDSRRRSFGLISTQLATVSCGVRTARRIWAGCGVPTPVGQEGSPLTHRVCDCVKDTSRIHHVKFRAKR